MNDETEMDEPVLGLIKYHAKKETMFGYLISSTLDKLKAGEIDAVIQQFEVILKNLKQPATTKNAPGDCSTEA